MSAEGYLCAYFIENFRDGGEVILFVLGVSVGGRTCDVVEQVVEIIYFDGVISQVVLEDYEPSLQLIHQLPYLSLQPLIFTGLY